MRKPKEDPRTPAGLQGCGLTTSQITEVLTRVEVLRLIVHEQHRHGARYMARPFEGETSGSWDNEIRHLEDSVT